MPKPNTLRQAMRLKEQQQQEQQRITSTQLLPYQFNRLYREWLHIRHLLPPDSQESLQREIDQLGKLITS